MDTYRKNLSNIFFVLPSTTSTVYYLKPHALSALGIIGRTGGGQTMRKYNFDNDTHILSEVTSPTNSVPDGGLKPLLTKEQS